MNRILIINADDLGYDPAVTAGMLEAMRRGVVASATFMVNTPFSAEAAEEAKGLRLGLHLNLARGEPISGGLNPAALRDGAFDESLAHLIAPESVADETAAQLDRFESLLGQQPTHLDVHKHLHLNPNVLSGIIVTARARRLPVRSIDAAMRKKLWSEGVATNDHFIGDAGFEAYWTLEKLEAHLAAVQPGITELMCHPGHAPSHVRSGYSAHREVELATFTDEKARALLAASGVSLADWTAVV
jgi:predicted glycoside hydrolase/deacetylase ChbG (UPF0249 family)